MSGSSTPTFTQITLVNTPVNPTDGATKAYVDAHGAGGSGLPVLASIAALRSANTTTLTSSPCWVIAYTSGGTVGGGAFNYIASDTTSSDNGGTIIVDVSGRRWYRFVDGPVSAWDFGAVGDNSTNNTTALQNWLTSGKNLYWPPGIFLTGALSLSNVNGVTIHGAGPIIDGPGTSYGTKVVLTQASSSLLTLTACGSITIRDLTFHASGAFQSLTSATGIHITGASGQITLDNCAVIGFSNSGVMDTGTSGAANDGNTYSDCLFLYNGNVNVYLSWSNDFFMHGCQIGNLPTTAPATYCMQVINGGGGNITDNFIWGGAATSGVNSSLIVTDVTGMRITSNRITQSNHQAFILTSSFGVTFSDNFVGNASLASAGVDDAALFIGCNNCVVTDNLAYDDTGTHPHRFGFFFQGGCTLMQATNNLDQGYDAGSAGPFASDLGTSPNTLSYNIQQVSVPFSSGVALTTNVFAAIGSLSLTAGVWELSATIGIAPNASTLNLIYGQIVGFGLSGPGTGSTSALYGSFLATSGDAASLTVGPTIVFPTAPETYTLEAQAAFSGGSCTGYGYMQAKRLA